MHIRSLLAALALSCAAPFLALCDDGSTDRPGRILFDTRYVVDAGSYLTNDIAHIALQKCFDIIPDSSAVLAYSRPVGSTNETDWAQLLPERPYSAHPADYTLPNAISNDVFVSIDYVPPTPVITNFMFRTAALRAMGFQPVSGYPIVVPGAKADIRPPRPLTTK